MSFESKILNSAYAHINNGGVTVSLKEQPSNSGSRFSLEFEMSSLGQYLTISIPMNRELLLWLTMALTERLDHIQMNDDTYNVSEKDKMFIHYVNKDEVQTNCLKDILKFKDFIQNFNIIK